MKNLISTLIVLVTIFPSLTARTHNLNDSTATHDSTITTALLPIQQEIFEILDEVTIGKTIKIDGQKITGNEYLIKLYQKDNYTPLWHSDKNRTDLISTLEGAYYEGLNANDYHIEYIKELETIKSTRKILSLEQTARADIIMTDAILTYAMHLIQGKVHPTDFDPHWNYSKRAIPDSVEFRLLERLKTETLADSIENIKTTLPMYAKLKHWFAVYDSMYKAGHELQQIEYPGYALRLGDTSAVVYELKMHLSNYGVPISQTDSAFNIDLELALKEFQQHNGLDADGIAGRNTFKALNISLKDRLNIIRVNLERCRWMNNELPNDYILVNIADFNLYLWRNRNIDYTCRVVVGKEQHETPVFTSDIKYVVFNPTWTVPYSIASKELLPKLKKDPNYLVKNNMTLLRSGKIVDPSIIDFNTYSKNNFPFTIRQEPGPNNALGQVKFMFPNKHAVYLHDTPSKVYFNKNERTFSHGCVRVQNPLILAEHLLEDKGYNNQKINEVLATKKLTNVYMRQALPIMLMYWTCYENNLDNKMYFFKDVYRRDKKVMGQLNKKR